jgi:molybdopterin synthase catalytic subunit
MSAFARLDPGPFNPEQELAALIAQAGGDGAIVCFTGLARPRSADGRNVSGLVLEHHPSLTVRSLEDIAADALARFDVSHVRVVHRCGEIPPGGPIVFAGAASRHRRAAFDAADYLMDRLKTEAIFWKQEVGADRSEWIEPTAADRAARERWD